MFILMYYTEGSFKNIVDMLAYLRFLRIFTISWGLLKKRTPTLGIFPVGADMPPFIFKKIFSY
jgi:hypothetical protein